MKRLFLAAAAVAALTAAAGPAFAWGDTGHRMVGRLAMENLPKDLPDFLRTSSAVDTVSEYAREPDRWRNSGKTHDTDRDPAHFVDLDDEGHTLAGKPLAELAPRRVDYEAQLFAAHTDQVKAGYLQYAMIDAWQQVVKDLAYWRVEQAALARTTDKSRKAWYAQDLKRREQLILRDIGIFAHYVGDGSQPMHLSVHFNGWGKEFANPQGFTLERIHTPFEGPFVRDHVDLAEARAKMKPEHGCEGAIDACVTTYLHQTWSELVPLYQLEKDGAFRNATPAGKAFAAERIADGASELRDLVASAWTASERMGVGYPGVTLEQVKGGADPWEQIYGDG